MSAPNDPRDPRPPRAAEAPRTPSAGRSRGRVEALDRQALERRYRLVRNLVVLLTALVIVLGAVSISQLVELRGAGGSQAAARANGASTANGTAGAADPAADEQTASGSCAAPERRDPDDPMAIGDVDAPIVLAEWTDFRCPYCGVFARDTLPQLIEDYVDTGKVRIEVHDVDFIDGEVSARVAAAARAAGAQERYFEYLFAVYDDMRDDRPEITDELLERYAKEAGVPDLQRFAADLDDPDLLAAVRASSAEARQLGVSSVPFFAETKGCEALQGAQPLDAFRDFLDRG